MLIEVKALSDGCEIFIEGLLNKPLKLTGPGETAVFDPKEPHPEVKLEVPCRTATG
jgi:hypothetical protein